MATIAKALASVLPQPKYTGEDEDVPQHVKSKGARVVGAGTLDESQIVLRVSALLAWVGF